MLSATCLSLPQVFLLRMSWDYAYCVELRSHEYSNRHFFSECFWNFAMFTRCSGWWRSHWSGSCSLPPATPSPLSRLRPSPCIPLSWRVCRAPTLRWPLLTLSDRPAFGCSSANRLTPSTTTGASSMTRWCGPCSVGVASCPSHPDHPPSRVSMADGEQCQENKEFGHQERKTCFWWTESGSW